MIAEDFFFMFIARIKVKEGHSYHIWSDRVNMQHQLGTTHLQKSMCKDALAEVHKEKDLRKEKDHRSEAMIAATNALMGERKEALQLLNDLLERSKHVHVSPYDIAYIYVALGENDLCFEYLEKAYEEYENELRFLKVEPLFDNIRSDPRFKALLKKIGVEE